MGVPENIKRLREKANMTQADFGRIAGVTDKAVSSWEQGTAEPRMGAVQKIADYFGLKKSDVIDDASSADIELQDLQEQLHKTPGMRTLFSLAKDATPEDLKLVEDMLKRMKKDSGFED